MSDLEFPDVMVDVETTGLCSGRTAILQIGAVRFNLQAGTVDHRFFNKSLSLPTHRFWDESTRNWWLNQKPHILQDIMSVAEKPEVVMNAFFDWSSEIKSKHFWAKPTSFDFPFIQSHLNDYGLPMPYSFREAMDVNTFIRTLHMPEEAPVIKPSDAHGDAHNALNDCFWQIELVMKHWTGRPA